MLSFKTAFTINFVVSALFMVPYVTMGLEGFVIMMSEGTLTAPIQNNFLMAVIGVDCAKNFYIACMNYFMMNCTDAALQRKVATVTMLMAIGCQVSTYIYPVGTSTMPPPPALVYIAASVGCFGAALLGDDGNKAKGQ